MTDPTTQVEQRFDHLIASAPQKRRAWSSNTAIVSLVIHSVLIAGAAYATVRAPDQQRSERPITFIELEPERVVEEARPEENARQAGPSPEARTETVTPPEETPLVIPEIDFTEPAISANTFSGEGTIDVIAEGVAGEGDAKPAEVFAYTVAELNEIPRLRNQLQMTSVFERLYPRILQDAGIGGTVWLEFVIEADGS